MKARGERESIIDHWVGMHPRRASIGAEHRLALDAMRAIESAIRDDVNGRPYDRAAVAKRVESLLSKWEGSVK